MAHARWLSIGKSLTPRRRVVLWVASFAVPMLLWSALSYLPFLWHPFMKITDAGDTGEYSVGEMLERDVYAEHQKDAAAAGKIAARGVPANPIYLPAPHQVGQALYSGFMTEPRLPTEPWLHQSLWHSIKVIFWGFVLSSIVGIPLGILCGAFPFFAKLSEPFTEFFRYLPAPAFGALCVAVLGIYDAPKIAIIFIGTFFQQVLVVANTTRKVDVALLEAAQTLGAGRRQLLFKVVVPAVIVDLYTDTRILLGWAWTYLIVAELVGTTTGITYFINQQARYRNYPNVYAGIILIGLIGLSTDLLLARVGHHLFPWQPKASRMSVGRMVRGLIPSSRRATASAGHPAVP
jgi:NitT/TauT family transport system permease protein